MKTNIGKEPFFFINIVIKFWNIFNVKSVNKGWKKRLTDGFPFSSIDDTRLDWLLQFASWLKRWKDYSDVKYEGCLTNESYETYVSLSHTVTTSVLMIKYLITECKLLYVLLAKFQTDELESRFGHYRQLSGASYLVRGNGK